uniref:Uncharacterized protein n=1 Tax=viral metagenome TaxID=1070528 RepID=A0A6C0CFS3_9ZZZZ
MEEELFLKTIKPTTNETYAILLDKVKDSFVAEVIEINESESYAIFKTDADKELKFLLNYDDLILKSDGNYEILDIERVIAFDLNILKDDIQQLEKQLTSDIVDGLDISLEEINEKEKVYTKVEIREDLLSSLIHSFNGYDNLQIIKNLNDTVDNLIELINKEDKPVYLYNINNDRALPKWLTPVVDNPMKQYGNIEGLIEFFDINEQEQLQFNQLNQMLYQSQRPIEPSLSDVGYTTNKVSTYLRDCLTNSTCISSQGSYSYDMRKNKNNTGTQIDNNINIIHPADSLNVVGLLYLSDTELRHTLPYNYNLFTLNELVFLNSINKLLPYKTLKDSMITSLSLTDDFVLDEINQNIFYTFTKRYETKEEFIDILKKITPSTKQLIDNMSRELRATILNYKDFKTHCIQYEIDPYCLESGDIKLVNELISDNVKRYLDYNSSLKEITIDEVLPKLPLELKMKMALSSILSMTNIPLRNEYIQKYIKIYTRSASGPDEDNLWLYNKYTNQRVLCKHYELLSIYHSNKDAFNSMITVYGGAAADGVIHCKNCGEYLCNEEFSLFEGFSDEQPSSSRDELIEDIDLLKEYKEDDILLVKLIASSIGTNLKEEDIQLVLEIYKNISNDILANVRYKSKNITVTDEHPRIKEIRKKYVKDKNKKKLISEEVNNFQLYIKNTNKIIIILSLCILVIQSAVPSYEIKKGKSISFIEFNDSNSLETVNYNMKYIDLCIHNTVKLCSNYKSDGLWNHYRLLSEESKTYDVLDLRKQIFNTIKYFVSPQYPKIQDKLVSYRTHLLSSHNVYVNYEWPTFKPLVKGELSTTVNTVLEEKDKDFKDYYILNYNNYPVENVSLITDIDTSKNIQPYELVNLDVSEIMVNKAFLLLFGISVSNYGRIQQINHSIDIHIERFLQTVQRKEEMIAIFKKYKWESSSKTGGLSYKTLRTKIIPEIISTYLKIDTDLSPCFSNEKVCNQFIHTNVNNYDLHLLKSRSKRIYNYKPFIVYPQASFEELSDEFKEKLFKRYCKDPSDKIIKRFINNDYLGKYLLPIDGEIEDNTTIYENNLRIEESNFKEIMKAVQCGLPIKKFIKPKYYVLDDYNVDIHNVSSETVYNLLRVLQVNSLDLSDENPIITLFVNIVGKDNYDTNEVLSIQRDINKSVSELSLDELISSCSRFISNVGREVKMLKRFENIFINTTTNININEEERKLLVGNGFKYKNMRESDVSKVFNMFLKGEKLTTDLCFHYLYTIELLIARLSFNYQADPKISKFWKLRVNDKQTMNNYMKNNYALLHQDIFRRDSSYKGFFNYHESLLFQVLHDYIKPYLKNIDTIKVTDLKLINPVINMIISKYVLILSLSKLIEFYDKLKSEDDEVISALETKYLSVEEEFNLYVCINTLEKFIMDLFINIFEVHYDSRWVVSNLDSDDLSKRLSKQKEKEKQQIIQNLDTMSDEKRASTVELQKIGVVSMYHQSVKANEGRVIDEYSSVDEGYDEIDNKEIVDAAISVSTGELTDLPVLGNLDTVQEEGYYDENDFNEEGETGDELQEFDQEELLDNSFEL